MLETSSAAKRDAHTKAEGDAMTLARLRHDIRNHLNTIKLSTALLHRQRLSGTTPDSIREIEKAADSINELVSRFMGDADAPGLFQSTSDTARAREECTGRSGTPAQPGPTRGSPCEPPRKHFFMGPPSARAIWKVYSYTLHPRGLGV